jgi:hypothetical protein
MLCPSERVSGNLEVSKSGWPVWMIPIDDSAV